MINRHLSQLRLYPPRSIISRVFATANNIHPKYMAVANAVSGISSSIAKVRTPAMPTACSIPKMFRETGTTEARTKSSNEVAFKYAFFAYVCYAAYCGIEVTKAALNSLVGGSKPSPQSPTAL